MQGPWQPIPGDVVRVHYGASVRTPDGRTVEAQTLANRTGRVEAARYSGLAYGGRGEVDVQGMGTVDVTACDVLPPTEGPEADARALRVSYKMAGRAWRGVLKNSRGKIVWECPHQHANRDMSSRTNGTAAVSCAATEKGRLVLVARHGEERGAEYHAHAQEIAQRVAFGRC